MVLHPSVDVERPSLTLRGHISVPRPGTSAVHDHSLKADRKQGELEPGSLLMNGVVYLVGLVVIVLAILSLLGLR
jgi:hypothetical protein